MPKKLVASARIQAHSRGGSSSIILNLTICNSIYCGCSMLHMYPRGGGGGGGGGGGALGYLGGRIRSLSKLKNTPKALIPGQRSNLILIKTLTFSPK